MRGRGPLPIPVKEKVLRGTTIPCRDAGKVDLVVDQNGPKMLPIMLDDDNPLAVIARTIWTQLYDKVVVMGVGEVDTNLFTRYCFLEANLRVLFSQGIIPSMDKMNTIRQMEELLRIAGPKSRVVTLTPPGGKPNSFSNNGKRG